MKKLNPIAFSNIQIRRECFSLRSKYRIWIGDNSTSYGYNLNVNHDQDKFYMTIGMNTQFHLILSIGKKGFNYSEIGDFVEA